MSARENTPNQQFRTTMNDHCDQSASDVGGNNSNDGTLPESPTKPAYLVTPLDNFDWY